MISTNDLSTLFEESVPGGTLIFVPEIDWDLIDIIKKFGWNFYNSTAHDASTEDFVEFILDLFGNDEDDFIWDDLSSSQKLNCLWEKDEEFIDPTTDEPYTNVRLIAIQGAGKIPIEIPKKVSDTIALCIIGPTDFEVEAKQTYVIY